MALKEITFPWHLSADELIDVFIIQWHTECLNNCSTINPASAEAKAALLKEFSFWLRESFDPKKPSRPLFILTPELSTPKNCDPVVEELVLSLKRPVVFIAGLEYLSWEEYKRQVESSELPEKSEWLAGGSSSLFVNAAKIWIGNNAKVEKFIQPKSFPSAAELSKIYLNSNFLLFKSQDQTPGKRINFGVQICSDFTSGEKVKKYRTDLISGLCKTHKLDITFLLQYQDDQEVEQFREAVSTYFDPPRGMIETSEGCLAFINNANSVHGKSKLWGKSKFHFQFDAKYSEPNKEAQPTYAVRNHGAFNFQECFLRERGAGIYHLAYKPRYLRNTTPGKGDEMPFYGQPCFSPIENNKFSSKTDEEKFQPIQPFIYWLNNEWFEGLSLIIHDLEKQGYQKQAINDFFQMNKKTLHEWVQYIGNNNLKAHDIIKTYYICFDEMPQYPFTTPEPEDWCALACEGINKFLFVYTLLGFAELKFSRRVSPNVSADRHALAGDSSLTFLFGGNKKATLAILSKFFSILSHISSVKKEEKCFFVIVDSTDVSSGKHLIEQLKSISQQLTPPEGVTSVSSLGEIVTGRSSVSDWDIVHSVNLITAFAQSKDGNDIAHRTSETLKACRA
jgi:hypothetical protein